jgi:hypothetical protein
MGSPHRGPAGMAPVEEPVTVFVVDDHDVVRKGLRF